MGYGAFLTRVYFGRSLQKAERSNWWEQQADVSPRKGWGWFLYCLGGSRYPQFNMLMEKLNQKQTEKENWRYNNCQTPTRWFSILLQKIRENCPSAVSPDRTSRWMNYLVTEGPWCSKLLDFHHITIPGTLLFTNKILFEGFPFCIDIWANAHTLDKTESGQQLRIQQTEHRTGDRNYTWCSWTYIGKDF